MKETVTLRINNDFAHLLFNANEGKNLGASVKVVELSKDDPRYRQIPQIENQVKNEFDSNFFFGWEINRKYSKMELDSAELFYMKIRSTFEPSGEECGTIFDESMACKICGANRIQMSPLTLKQGSIPKKDVSRTIAGEIVVSEMFTLAYKERRLKGVSFEPIYYTDERSDYFQLLSDELVELSYETIAGVNPFDLSKSNENEIYQCPLGHTIGLNILSEPYVRDTLEIKKSDFIASKQKIGVKRGLLRPMPINFCSQDFRRMVVEEKLSGFNFEIARIV